MNDNLYINAKKKEIREKYLAIRKNIINREEKTKEILDRLLNDSTYQKANTIALFKSFNFEVDTNSIIDISLSNNKVVALPRIEQDEIVFYKINSKSILVKNKYKIEEPISKKDNYIEKENIDLVIVPGLCFDRSGNRLGYGKGFYDRFLSGTSIRTIAICFDEQLLDEGLLPASNSDVKIEEIITNKEKIKINSFKSSMFKL